MPRKVRQLPKDAVYCFRGNDITHEVWETRYRVYYLKKTYSRGETHVDITSYTPAEFDKEFLR